MQALEFPRPEVGKIIENYQSIPYVHENGPWLFPEGHPGDISIGVNCQMFFQEYLQAVTGFQIPRGMLSKEIFEDDQLFHPIPVDNLSDLQIGDVFMFGRDIPSHTLDPRTLHLAGFSHYDESGIEPILVHFLGNRRNENDEGIPIQTKPGPRVWPLQKFSEEKYAEKYGKRWAIKRLDTDALLQQAHPLSQDKETILAYFSEVTK